MNPARAALATAGLAGFAAVAAVGLSALPAPGAAEGPVAAMIASTAVAARHATDLVSAVVFDYRGFDTLGEEFILVAATAGIELLLRPLRRERLEMERAARALAPVPGPAIRFGARQAGTLALLLGVVMGAHGHESPGGGFQGGVAVGAAALCVFLAAHLPTLRAIAPEQLASIAEGAGAAAFVALGGFGVVLGGAYLENVLPLGRPGTLLSAGIIPLANLAVLAAVGGAFAAVLKEFIEQAVGTGLPP